MAAGLVKNDLTGQKINRWHVGMRRRENGKTEYFCTCECGVQRWVNHSNLASRASMSCGCFKTEVMNASALDLTGQRFGRLLVIDRNPEKTVAKKIMWNCVCDCGNRTISQTNNLRSGNSSSCGKCARIIDKNDPMIDWAKYAKYKDRAVERGFEFEFSIEEFHVLIRKNCHYCGLPPDQKVLLSSERGLVHGIDRIDSNIGYSKSNSVTCCDTCNKMKSAHSTDEFRIHLKRVISHMCW